MTLDREKLKDLLASKNISRRELSKKSMVPLGSLNHWFSHRSPKALYIVAIARALHVDPSRITTAEPETIRKRT